MSDATATGLRSAIPTPDRRPITRKMLLDWAGVRVFRDAEVIFLKGHVEDAKYRPPHLRGSIRWANRSLKSELHVLPDGTAENRCPCRDSTERGIICSHVIALGLSILDRATDPEREQKHSEERRRSERMERFDESAYIQRVSPDSTGAIPAALRLVLREDWIEAARSDVTPLLIQVEADDRCLPIEDVSRDLPLAFDTRDDAMLFVLEDISEGPARSELQLRPSDLINVLALRRGRPLHDADGNPLPVNEAPMASRLHVNLDHENGELLLFLHTELPFMRAGDFPMYFISNTKGWVYGAGNFWPLEQLLPLPLQLIYRDPISIPRSKVPAFLRKELPFLESHIQVESELSIDLFTFDPGAPEMRLLMRGSPASLAPTLYAAYNGITVIPGRDMPDGPFAIPDPEDITRYTVRNSQDERGALGRLAKRGMAGSAGDDLTPIVGVNEVRNFIARDLPALRREGWTVEFEGRINDHFDELSFMTPVVSINDDRGSFGIDFHFETTQGRRLPEAEVQRAILKGDSFLELDGKPILFDSDAIASMNDVFNDLASSDGRGGSRFRIDDIYGAFVKSSLDGLDGIDVEAPQTWRESAVRLNRGATFEEVSLNPQLTKTLRPYQKEGVNWLRFLEASGFAGILADEMGLGKTLQTLAWIQLRRLQDGCHARPTLIICPTSLVENWAEEAARFVPDLGVLMISGSERHAKWDQIESTDMAITSYALLRRDIERYGNIEFSIVILDEAQHIKNRSTQNAVAAKKLRSTHRLVLTGTPIENSVADLWSIMDFLLPGYLNGHEHFRQAYELPIARGDEEADHAHRKLRCKLHPFILRRLKIDVAKDLPARIDKISSCSLSNDQKQVYEQYLHASRTRITTMLSKRKFGQCRMEILKVLLRLRQICCHLDLLKLPDSDRKQPSAKMDLFLELLDEALDGGHRILVFSQFTQMLAILRREIESRDLSYCYLDGATKERMAAVREFNTNRSIPLFLISLKAGGTGLNLTGADTVIHYDPWWNPAVENQATDRAHRIGQKRTVYSLKLITKDTIEEKVLAMQKRKQSIIDKTLSPENGDGFRLTREYVGELLNI